MNKIPIDYRLLTEAIHFYEKQGFEYVETPWIVSRKADQATKPTLANELRVLGYDNLGDCTNLVASGEQSFVQCMLEGKDFMRGRLQTVTPCFRNETEYKEGTLPYFLKLELISSYSSEKELGEFIECAYRFFKGYAFDGFLYEVKTHSGVDICLNGVEIGSYGIRKALGYEWVYGTGLALPRFNYALSLTSLKS
jgi:hypothetical protein